jgi:hypothetical protein
VSFDAALMLEFGRHHLDAIMRASAFTRSSMSCVTVGLVDDVEKNRIERHR